MHESVLHKRKWKNTQVQLLEKQNNWINRKLLIVISQYNGFVQLLVIALSDHIHCIEINFTQKETIMSANQILQIRIDRSIKEELVAALGTLYITVSYALKLMLTKILREHNTPLDLLIPNADIIAAMKEQGSGSR
jgi:DNA-damage-inducible protein J